MGLSRDAQGWKSDQIPYTYNTKMRIGAVTLKTIQNIYETRETFVVFWYHQHFSFRFIEK